MKFLVHCGNGYYGYSADEEEVTESGTFRKIFLFERPKTLLRLIF